MACKTCGSGFPVISLAILLVCAVTANRSAVGDPTVISSGTYTVAGTWLNTPVNVASGATLALSNTSGLFGQYYSQGVTATASNFTTAIALNAHLAATNSAFAYAANSALTGNNVFNFGDSGGTGSLFPAPFLATGTTNFDAAWNGLFLRREVATMSLP